MSEENQNQSNLPVVNQDNRLFPFDVAPVITLKDGTIHSFRLPEKKDEQVREDRMKTVIITQAGRINGQQPKQSTTDYSKSEIGYYDALIESVKGFKLDETSQENEELNAHKILDEIYDEEKRKNVPVTIVDFIPTKHKRAAASRIFGGKFEVEKKTRNENAVEGEEEKEILVLRLSRKITVLQKLGVEQNTDGTFTDATHTIAYVFNEPKAKHLSLWETRCFNGFTIPLNNGGSREERTFNLDAIEKLFDSLIAEVQGASVENQPVDCRIKEHLAKIPLSVKKTTVAFLMGEVTGDVGNE